MKSVYLLLTALVAPVATQAQTLPFNVQCLSPAQQEEVRTRSVAIRDHVAALRQKAGGTADPAVTLNDAMELRSARSVALSDCARAAKAANKGTMEACEAQLMDLKVATSLIDELSMEQKPSLPLIAQEEKVRLQDLRGRYPVCR